MTTSAFDRAVADGILPSLHLSKPHDQWVVQMKNPGAPSVTGRPMFTAFFGQTPQEAMEAAAASLYNETPKDDYEDLI